MNKQKMAQFLKLKFNITLKLNFNGGQFYNNIKFWLRISKS